MVKNAAAALEWACGPTTTGKLEPNQSHLNFGEASLNVDFDLLMVANRSPGTNDTVSPRASKRRKISTDSVLEEITKKLYLLLGTQEATDLSGLGQEAV